MMPLKHTHHCQRAVIAKCEDALGSFYQMDELPMVQDVISILHMCRGRKDPALAKRVHAHICCIGLEAHRDVGNHIVPLLMECGTIRDAAQQAFNRMPHHNVHSWNSLLAGLTKCGELQNALNLYQKMQEDNVYPSSYTFVAILKASNVLEVLERGQEIHFEIVQQGHERDIFVGSTLVDMYAKSGFLSDARVVFDKLPVRDVVTWNALMAGYAEHGPGQEALSCFECMRMEGTSPDSVSFICILKACGSIAAIDKGRVRHLEIIQVGSVEDPFVDNTLVDMYAKCGSLAEAQQVFDKLPLRDVVTWNALMAGYAEHGPSQEALKCFKQMQLQSVAHDAVSFVCVLKACSLAGEIDMGQEIHTEITQKGFEGDLDVCNSMIDMYASCGLLSEAQVVFDKLPIRTAASWYALIAGYAEQGLGQESLKYFEHMQMEIGVLNAAMYVCGLKVCVSVGCKDKGQQLLTEIVQKGLESDVSVGNILVSMYAKFHLLSEAHAVLDTLFVGNNAVSWNALLIEYMECGLSQEALCCFEHMRQEGVFLNAATFVCGLQACGSLREICKGQEFHKEIMEMGLEREIFVGNTLVDMYAKNGLFAEAQSVFDKLPVRDVVTWNALISGYADHGPGWEALKYYEQMQVEGAAHDATTLVCVLKACGNTRALDRGQEMHSEITKKRLEGDIFISNVLVAMYAKCASCPEAQDVFDKMSDRNVMSWNSLIGGYAECGLCLEALKCFEYMQLEAVFPNAVTFVCVLKACGTIGALARGQSLHTDIVQRGLDKQNLVGNILVDMYAKCGSLVMARVVFDMLLVRNVVSWTALISGYAEHGPGHEALMCLEQMQLDGVHPDAAMFACVLKACGSIQAIGKAQELHNEVVQKGLERELLIGSTLVNVYARWVSLVDAREVFDKLAVRNIVSWTALIVGYAEHGPYQEVLQCFEQMQLEGVVPDNSMYACAIKACGSTGAIDKGRQLHLETAQKGFETDLLITSSLVHMYAKCGFLIEAHDTFDKLSVRNVVSWSAMIKGYGMNREGAMAVQVFEDMRESGVKPNAVTFTNLLFACGRASLESKGQDCFKAMREDYHVMPTTNHFTSMVCLLARAGHLDAAEKFLVTIPCTPSKDMWMALLSSCKTFVEADLGLKCFKQLVQMNPESAAPYVLMANIYASAGRLSDTYGVEKLRKQARATKRLASALI